MRAMTRTSFVSIALLAAVSLSGCSLLQGSGGGETVARDAETQEITEAGTADVFKLKVGDCFDDGDLTGQEVSDVAAVPCAQPHDNEVYYEFTMSGEEWPGEEAIGAAVDEQCAPQFDTFVGLSFEESVLKWFPLTPTEGSWTQLNDRVVQCVVYENGVRVEGTLAGAAR